jgi:two-component system nitrate/nitrite response regulator NarL
MTVFQRRVRLLLADEGSLFRGVVKAWLDEQPDMWVVAQASALDQIPAAMESTRPDVIVINLTLDEPHRVGAMIREVVTGAAVVGLAEREDLDLLVMALDAGATAYLSTDAGMPELAHAVRAVRAGEIVVPAGLSSPLLAFLLRRRGQTRKAGKAVERLTRRERLVLALLADGANNQAIAEVLGISPQTARTHVQNLLRKLSLHSKLEAAAFVLEHGLRDELLGSEDARSLEPLPARRPVRAAALMQTP